MREVLFFFLLLVLHIVLTLVDCRFVVFPSFISSFFRNFVAVSFLFSSYMTYTFFLTLEPYLAQWLRSENGGTYPIELKRGSVEAKYVELHLRPQPADSIPQLTPKENQVPVALPWFKNRDIRTYNFLPDSACAALKDLIRNRFIIQLWEEVHTFEGVNMRLDHRLIAFMESHGIQNDDTNYNSVHKIYDRLKNTYRKREQRKKSKK